MPLNLTQAGRARDYMNTGAWSKKAITEGRATVACTFAADEAASGYCTVPASGGLKLSADAAYLHYTPNETIGGVEFPYIPGGGNVPLVADMTSTLLSRPIEVSRFGLIYAGAQKNFGPVGLNARHRARGAARAGARGDTRSYWTTRRSPRKARCSIRRRPSPGMSRASSSSG
jgi:phosphoserine aminotransferase